MSLGRQVQEQKWNNMIINEEQHLIEGETQRNRIQTGFYSSSAVRVLSSQQSWSTINTNTKTKKTVVKL